MCLVAMVMVLFGGGATIKALGLNGLVPSHGVSHRWVGIERVGWITAERGSGPYMTFVYNLII